MRLLSTYKMLIRSHRNPASLRLKDLDILGRNNEASNAVLKHCHYPVTLINGQDLKECWQHSFRSALQPSSLSLPAEFHSKRLLQISHILPLKYELLENTSLYHLRVRCWKSVNPELIEEPFRPQRHSSMNAIRHSEQSTPQSTKSLQRLKIQNVRWIFERKIQVDIMRIANSS